MRSGRGIEEHIAEQAGKAHEILILEPAAGGEADNLTAELVFAFAQIGRQLKVAGREGIGGKADVMAVEPENDAALCALEGYEHAPALHGVGQIEILAVAGDGVEILRDFADLKLLETVPGILHIDILWLIISFHLDMCWYIHVFP